MFDPVTMLLASMFGIVHSTVTHSVVMLMPNHRTYATSRRCLLWKLTLFNILSRNSFNTIL